MDSTAKLGKSKRFPSKEKLEPKDRHEEDLNLGLKKKLGEYSGYQYVPVRYDE